MITIENKDTRPSIKNIMVPYNYVLVLMDPSYSSFQMKGKEMGIIASTFIYNGDSKVAIPERLVSPFGRIMKTPMGLIYNGREIKRLVDKYQPVREINEFNDAGERLKVIAEYSVLKQITALKKASISYDTDLEVCEGDRVHVSYLHFLNAEKEGLFIETQEGNMVMVKYDMLRMVVDENDQPKKMLNGYLLIQPRKIEVDVKKENGTQFVEQASGIVLLPDTAQKTNRKRNIATILVGGTPLRGYLEEGNKSDIQRIYKGGDKILFDPRYALKLENDLHQVISEKDLYLIRRDAIIMDEYTMDIDFEKIEI